MSFAYVIGPCGNAVSFKVGLEWLWFWPKLEKRTMTFRVGMLSSDINVVAKQFTRSPDFLSSSREDSFVFAFFVSHTSRAPDSNKKSREFTRGT